MNKKRLLSFLFLFVTVGVAFAQGPKVPSQMEFAGMQLKISDAARRTIQSDVDAIHRSRKYLDQKLERVNMYFPIIERILKEEGVPDDFKYLSVQESSLVPDAVSSSNAVGYWQFKKETAEEVGMRVSGPVDERKNIVSATRGAARYLKRNYNFFDNWVYTLLSYQQGAGGAMKIVDKRHYGATKYTVTKKDHWYVLRFLAHKIAYQDELYKDEPRYNLVEYTRGAGKTLKEISKEADVDGQMLEDYNKWLSRGRIPEDKTYAVILPVKSSEQRVLADVSSPKQEPRKGNVSVSTSRFGKDDPGAYPKIEGHSGSIGKQSVKAVINGRQGVIAGPAASVESLALLGGVSESKFLKYNDMPSTKPVEVGQVYYFQKKKGKATVYQHVVLPGETWWSISQKYGLKEKALLRKNREREAVPLKTGRVLWMRFTRPSDEAVTYRNVKEVEIENAGEETQPIRKPVVNRVSENSGIQEHDPVEEAEPETEKESYPEVTEIVDTTLASQPAGGEPEASPQPETEELMSPEREEDTENYTFKQASEDLENTENSDVRWVEVTDGDEGESDNKVQKHTVKAGETLFSLSRMYKVPVDDLKAWNNLTSDNLREGEELWVTTPEEKAGSNTESYETYVVQPGETLYAVARKYGITLQQLMQANGLESFDISAGQKLKIPSAKE